ncbi:MAG: MFS transporter [Thermomicrobiales bacterium]|nr:MFS transporter [Thermomicrobiales bacterium]
MNDQTNPTLAQTFRTMLGSPAILAGLLCCFVSAVDLTVIASILPGMIGDLGVNTADFDRYIWIVNSYLIAYVVAIPIVGRMSDHTGRQIAFMACLLIFAVGSIVAASADSMTTIIVGRVIQGMGGGGLLPVTVALAGDVLPPRMRLAGIGLVSSVETLGWVMGPTWGAAILAIVPNHHDPWRWVFWINVPVAIIALFAIWRGFPHGNRGSQRPLTDIDLLGIVLLAVVLVASNLAISSGGDHGAGVNTGLRAFGGTPNPMGEHLPMLIGITIIGDIALVVWERRAPHPIFPMELFRQGYFVATVFANFLIGAALMVGMVNIPVLVSLSSDSSASRDSALLLIPLTLTIAVFALASGSIGARIGEWTMARLGVVLAALGFGSVYLLIDMDHLWHIVPGLAIAGAGIGMLMAPLSATALDAADDSNRGAATSTALLCRLLGMTIGMSLVTTAGIYRLQQLTGRLDPIVQEPGESTAGYFVRQQQFVNEVLSPLGVQVMQETFLVAAALTALAIVPVMRMKHIPIEAT